MIIETFEEAQQACAAIARLAAEASANPQAAKALIARCAGTKARMVGKFGNVGEQLARIMDAARPFTRSSFELTAATANLSRALARMDAAMDLHRSRFGD